MRLRSEADVQERPPPGAVGGGGGGRGGGGGGVFNLESLSVRVRPPPPPPGGGGAPRGAFADRKEDQARLMPLVEDLMKNGD